MSEREWFFFIEDMLSAIDKIQSFTRDEQYESFISKPMLIDAVLHNFMVIGEAAGNVPSEIRERYNKIEWRKISGFRNIVVHEYFGIFLKTVWDTMEKNLPDLKAQVLNIKNE